MLLSWILLAILPVLGVLANPRSSNTNTCKNGSITLKGRQCERICGYEYTSGSYKTDYRSCYNDCASACAADNRCKTAKWSHETKKCCYHSGDPYLQRKSRVDAVKCKHSPRTSTTASRRTSSTTRRSTTRSSSAATSSTTSVSTTSTTASLTSASTTSTAGPEATCANFRLKIDGTTLFAASTAQDRLIRLRNESEALPFSLSGSRLTFPRFASRDGFLTVDAGTSGSFIKGYTEAETAEAMQVALSCAIMPPVTQSTPGRVTCTGSRADQMTIALCDDILGIARTEGGCIAVTLSAICLPDMPPN